MSEHTPPPNPFGNCRPSGTPTEVVALTVRVGPPDRDEFIRDFYPDIMEGGIFIRTNGHRDLNLGLTIQLKIVAEGGNTIFAGNGLVAWIQRRGGEQGIGIQFKRLTPQSLAIYREMLRLKRSTKAAAAPTLQELHGDELEDQEFFHIPTRPMNPATRMRLARQTLPPLQRDNNGRRAPRITPSYAPIRGPERKSPSSEYSLIRRRIAGQNLGDASTSDEFAQLIK